MDLPVLGNEFIDPSRNRIAALAPDRLCPEYSSRNRSAHTDGRQVSASLTFRHQVNIDRQSCRLIRPGATNNRLVQGGKPFSPSREYHSITNKFEDRTNLLHAPCRKFRRQALLRGRGFGPGDTVPARICRRLSRLAGTGGAFCKVPYLHHHLGARLSRLGHSGRPRRLQPGDCRGRCACGSRSSRDRQGAYMRDQYGGLYRAALGRACARAVPVGHRAGGGFGFASSDSRGLPGKLL